MEPIKSEVIASFSNSELEKLPIVKVGDEIECFHCGSNHKLMASMIPKKKPSGLLFYKCSGKTYLGAVDNRLVTKRFQIA